MRTVVRKYQEERRPPQSSISIFIFIFTITPLYQRRHLIPLLNTILFADELAMDFSSFCFSSFCFLMMTITMTMIVIVMTWWQASFLSTTKQKEKKENDMMVVLFIAMRLHCQPEGDVFCFLVLIQLLIVIGIKYYYCQPIIIVAKKPHSKSEALSLWLEYFFKSPFGHLSIMFPCLLSFFVFSVLLVSDEKSMHVRLLRCMVGHILL